MPLLDHLREARRRLIFCAIGIAAGGIVGWALSDLIIQAGAAPIDSIPRVDAALNFTTVSAAFDLRFRVALTAGIVLASPVWLYNLWAFIVPGLTPKEMRYGILFVALAVPLFISGAAAGWLVMPNIVSLLVSFAPEDTATLLSASEYFDFLLRLTVAVGLAFVAPLGIVALNAAGVITARSVIRAWRVAIAVILIFSAAVTPSADVLSMFLLAAPVVALYFGAYLWCAIHDRRQERQLAQLTSVPV